MRIVSLIPAITEITFDIGLSGELVAVSGDSDWPPELHGLPVVTRRAAPGAERSVRGDKRRLIAASHGCAADQVVDRAVLETIGADLVLGQERCPACSLDVRPAGALVGELEPAPSFLSIEAGSVEGMLNAITTVGAMTETEDDAIDLVEALRTRLGAVEQVVAERRDAGRRARRVVALQQLDPPAAAGHWVPEQVRRAGGWEVLGEPGGAPIETSWDAIREVDPELLVLMPAELDMTGALAAWERTPLPGFWEEIEAVRAGQVFLVDGPGLFTRPSPRMIEGIELLAELLDREAFPDLAPAGSWMPLG